MTNNSKDNAETDANESAGSKPPAVFSDPPLPLGECQPVAWQKRFKNQDGWTDWAEIDTDIELFRYARKFSIETGRLEIRPLYASPPSVGVDREQLAEMIAKQFPAILAQYSQFKIADFILSALRGETVGEENDSEVAPLALKDRT